MWSFISYYAAVSLREKSIFRCSCSYEIIWSMWYRLEEIFVDWIGFLFDQTRDRTIVVTQIFIDENDRNSMVVEKLSKQWLQYEVWIVLHIMVKSHYLVAINDIEIFWKE